jgi:hypothetical protein
LLLLPPRLLLAELLLAVALLRLRTLLLTVLLAVFVAPLTVWLRDFEPIPPEPVDRVLEPPGRVLLDAAAFLPVVDLTLADLPLADLPLVDPGLLILPDVLLILLLAVFLAVLPAVLLEADEAERLFCILIPSLSPFPLILSMASASLPSSLAMLSSAITLLLLL